MGIARSCNYVSSSLLLLLDELGNELRVMREVGVHEDHVLPCAFSKAVDIGTTESQLAWAGMQLNFIAAINPLQFSYNLLGAVW